MNAMTLIQNAMQRCEHATLGLIEDMRDAPLTQPTSRGGNHPLWVLGHITFIEAGVPSILFGEGHPLEHWAPLFAPGTKPKTDATAYPSFDEILRTYRDARARNLRILEELGETGLDRPTVAPPRGLENVLRTAGDTFLTIAIHQMNHRGQVADARRAAGRKPVFTPGPAASQQSVGV
jgi:hypothetical protein